MKKEDGIIKLITPEEEFDYLNLHLLKAKKDLGGVKCLLTHNPAEGIPTYQAYIEFENGQAIQWQSDTAREFLERLYQQPLFN